MAALDEALGTYLEWDQQNFQDAVKGIGQGYEDVIAGRTRPAAEFLNDMRRKHGLPALTRSQLAGQRIRELRKGLTLGGVPIKELIEEGRE